MPRAVTGRQLQQSIEIVARVFATNEFRQDDMTIVIEALEIVRDVCGDLVEKLREVPGG